jgi:hypothetical protein
MGNSTPIISSILPTDKKKKTFPDTFKGNYEKYKYLHEKLGTIIGTYAQNTLDDINHGDINQIGIKVRKSYNSYKNEINKLNLGLKKFDYEDVMYDLCTEKILKDYMIIENYDLFHELPKLFKKYLNKDSVKINKAKEVLKSFEKIFPQKMKTLIYDLTNKNLKDLESLIILGINRNIKYNNDFKPEILSIILNSVLLEDTLLLFELAEILQFVKTIQIVTIIINPIDKDEKQLEDFNFNILNHKLFNKIIFSIRNNRSIKGLFIQFNYQYGSLVISPETCESIIKKIQSETLSAFYLGNFDIAESLMDKFIFTINNSKALIFFGYDIHKKNFKIIKRKFIPMIKGNKIIQAYAFTGITGEDKKTLEEYESQILENKKVLIYYVGENTLVQYPFNSENSE